MGIRITAKWRHRHYTHRRQVGNSGGSPPGLGAGRSGVERKRRPPPTVIARSASDAAIPLPGRTATGAGGRSLPQLSLRGANSDAAIPLPGRTAAWAGGRSASPTCHREERLFFLSLRGALATRQSRCQGERPPGQEGGASPNCHCEERIATRQSRCLGERPLGQEGGSFPNCHCEERIATRRSRCLGERQPGR